MSQQFFARLMSSTQKRLDLKALRLAWLDCYPEQLHTHDRDRLLLDALHQGEREGLLKLPAKPSYERFGNPPMPTFITLIREAKKASTVDYAKVAWAPEMGFWTRLSPQELITAVKINEWIIRRRGKYMQVPLRERSLEIFGDEKYLDSRHREGALFGGRLQLSVIGAKLVEHPLAYRPADAEGMPVLLVENHHTFWSLGEWNEAIKMYSAVVYGNGKTICGSGLALAEVMRERGAVSAEYFGDLDPAGIDIPLIFNQKNEQQITPCISLYERLLANGRHKGGITATPFDVSRAQRWLPSLSVEIAAIWEKGNWIPQEGLGLEQLFNYEF
jgi:hypothetical protein